MAAAELDPRIIMQITNPTPYLNTVDGPVSDGLVFLSSLILFQAWIQVGQTHLQERDTDQSYFVA